jgi:UTP--glucose-1-phosphate uridylyltransferase
VKVQNAVIPVAGLGTRFLPATKATPKEMLPVVDTPAIQLVVEEAVRAGVTDILMVTGRGKRSIEDHFDRSAELEYFLEAKGKFDELKQVRAIAELASIYYTRQRDPLGLGHAIACAETHIGDKPFVVMLPDDLVRPRTPLLDRMLKVHERYGRSVLAAIEVGRDEASLYGMIEPEPVEEDLVRIVSIIEKPAPERSPSTLAAIGRYVFTPEIFDALEAAPDLGPDTEIGLTDGIARLSAYQTVYAYLHEGGRFDIGEKLDYLRATVQVACDRDDLGPTFRAWLGQFCKEQGLV